MNSNSTRVRCEDCYFRHAELCALQVNEACPTFRPHVNGALAQQLPLHLAARPLDEVVRTAQLKVAAA
jgi:hypothetical protein